MKQHQIWQVLENIPETSYDIIKGLNPDQLIQFSQAISLKRIADMLEPKRAPGRRGLFDRWVKYLSTDSKLTKVEIFRRAEQFTKEKKVPPE